MHRFRFPAVVLMLAAFLCVRLVGTHLHLCFDGTEPPMSLQSEMDGLHDMIDDGERQSSASQLVMQDVDIDLAGEVVVKIAKPGLDLPVIMAFIALLILLPRPSIPLGRSPAELFVPFARSRIRPPLRAPPR